MGRLFLEQSNHRRLPPDYAGDILLWDIDKTYLNTRFSSMRGLAKIPFEWAIDKQSIPGSVPLLRALRRGPGKDSAIVPLFFVSGSPPQLRKVVERRMTMDGVHFDGITFKDQWGLLKHGRPRGLKEQIGYKLAALLLYRRAVPAEARWLMFGDDVEADAEVFLLFGDVCAGERGGALEQTLRHRGVSKPDIANILELTEGLEEGPNPVERVFIHLERKTKPDSFTDPKVVPTYSYLQAALVLRQMQRVQPQAVTAVGQELRLRHVPEAEIQRQLEDARVRLKVPAELLELARQ